MAHRRRSKGLCPRGDGTRGPRTPCATTPVSLSLSSVLNAVVCCVFHRDPFRSLFLIFLLSGFNLEGNVNIGSEETAGVIARSREIAAMSPQEYFEFRTHSKAALEQLPVVASCFFQDAKKLNDSYARVNLNCTAQCGQEQRPKLRCSQKCPTTAQAAEILLQHISRHHKQCILNAAPQVHR